MLFLFFLFPFHISLQRVILLTEYTIYYFDQSSGDESGRSLADSAGAACNLTGAPRVPTRNQPRR